MNLALTYRVHLVWLLLGPLAGAAAAQDTDEDWFADEVAPVLKMHCAECHGPDVRRPKGGLRMSGRAALLEGGTTGPALAPGDPDASLLIRAVRYEAEDLEMPPDGKLADEEIAVLEEWVRRGAPWSPEAVDPQAARFFEEQIRPLLAEQCFRCHGPDAQEVEGGFRMAGREGLLVGGNLGAAIVPGEPEASRLVTALKYEDHHLKMPPDGKLADRDIRRFERWIAMGAPWPTYDGPALEEVTQDLDLEAGRQWWSFRPVVRPSTPPVEHESEVRRPLDAFVLARLEAAGLEPNPPATDRELVRRLYFDVLGLPPTQEEVEAYVGGMDSDRWERLVDAVLARPEYGERFGRRWLDVVRFAQTNGYERDTEKPHAGRYRDWVVDAFNEDMAYDRFLMAQLAGDELDDAEGDTIVPTAFYRLGSWDDEPDDAAQAEFEELDDVVRVIGEGLMGVTLGCARCHDHKFDPFSQEDYYSLVAFLRSVQRYENPRYALDSPTLRPLDASPEKLEGWSRDRDQRAIEVSLELSRRLEEAGRENSLERREAASAQVQESFRTPPAQRTKSQRAVVSEFRNSGPGDRELIEWMDPAERRMYGKLLVEEEELKTSFEGDLDWALRVTEAGAEIVPTRLLLRGRASSPGYLVEPRFVRVLCETDAEALPAASEPPSPGESTGLRLQLAEWVSSPENPLTARVIANRVWAGLLGRGVVPTPNDFGRAGIPPTHPQLLDWLASELVANDWSLKALHREILLSAAYRRSSNAANPGALVADPGNDLFWRRDLIRLEAEAIRDSILFASGELQVGGGGRGFFPRLSREALAGMSRPGRGWGVSSPKERAHRSIYAFAKRGIQPPLLEVFDLADPSLPIGARPVTTTASQALILLNNDFVNEQAANLAARVMSDAGSLPADQVQRAFQLTIGRSPDETEAALSAHYLVEQAAAFEDLVEPLVLRPAVPDRLDSDFLSLLDPQDLLYGPRDGWRYLRGEWGNYYNGTVERDADHGPAVLLTAARHTDVQLKARLRAHAGCEQVGLVLRASAEGDRLLGIEYRLEPLRGTGVLLLRTLAGVERLVELDLNLRPERWYELGVVLNEGLLSATLDGVEWGRVDLSSVDLPAEGAFGMRVVGEGAELEGGVLLVGGGQTLITPDAVSSGSHRALEALCLALYNTNEFVYVD